MKVQRAATENKSHGLQAAWPNRRRDGRRDGVREWWGVGGKGFGGWWEKKKDRAAAKRETSREQEQARTRV